MNKANPLISIIVRTKDRPDLFISAMDSIVSQTYKKLEIIVVNDGGCDVEELAKKRAGKLPVHYLCSKVSVGRAAAANKGLQAVQGQYFAFLDDDDILYPNHFETLLPFLNNDTVVYSGVLSVYYNCESGKNERVKEKIEFNADFDPDLLLFENYIPFMSLVFPIEVLNKVGELCEEMTLFEDWDFIVRISRHFTFIHVDRITAEYRFYNVASVKDAHRIKYEYNDSLAFAFNRFVSFLTGNAWVAFLERGMVARLKKNISSLESYIEDLERKNLYRESHINKLESYIENLKRKIKNDGEHIAKLSDIIGNFQALVEQGDKENKRLKNECVKLAKNRDDLQHAMVNYESIIENQEIKLEELNKQNKIMEMALKKAEKSFYYRFFIKNRF